MEGLRESFFLRKMVLITDSVSDEDGHPFSNPLPPKTQEGGLPAPF